jgi:hypothetical protein
MQKIPGGVLLSHAVTHAVPSALEGLTTVFGMGTGVSLPPLPPEKPGMPADLGSYGHQNLTTKDDAEAERASIVHETLDQASRPISTTRLNTLLCLHLWPINLLVSKGPLGACARETSSWEGLRAYMLSALIPAQHSYPAMPLARQPVHQRLVHPSPLVRGTASLKSPPPTRDRDRTVSRRSKPSSRTTLIGEQPNPWDLLQPQDVMSRHRGAKPPRRYELSAAISLLSPEYLLSVKQRPFHTESPDH